MGIISEAVSDLIARQVDEHGIVVWYDPEGSYRDLAAALRLPQTLVLRYAESFFALRQAAEPALAGNDPGRLVVYVPLARTRCGNALVELESAGVIVAPGQSPVARNSRLAVIARRVLQPRLGAADLLELETRINAGELGVSDLDTLAARPPSLAFGALALIFGGGAAADLALVFLSNRAHDLALVQKNALGELAAVLHSALGLPAEPPGSPETLRERLAQLVLLGEVAGEPRCSPVAAAWRSRRDLRGSYAEWAERIERTLPAGTLPVGQGETFLAQERALLHSAGELLCKGADEQQLALAESRQAGFWAGERPEVQAHWALLAAAAGVLAQADRVLAGLRSLPPDAVAVLHAYTDGPAPWCLLDTWQRRLERRWHDFPHGPAAEHQPLERLMSLARQRYAEAAGELSEFMLRRCDEARFRLSGALRQTEVYGRYVRPRLEQGRVAYLLVDALRYEMARELAELAHDAFEVELRPALAAAPTVTEVGMAALLPGAEQAEVQAVGGKPVLAIEGRPLPDRAARLKYLSEQVDGDIVVLHLHELLPTPKKRFVADLAKARLVVVTSREIDSLGEKEEDVLLARRTMDDMLHQLRRAIRLLSEHGIEAIVVAADHGFLFGEELADEMKAAAPRGETLALHRRVWVGRAPEPNRNQVRVRLSDLGLGGELEVVVPWGLGGFKARGGGRAYFHGGLSLPEWVVPVLVLVPRVGKPPTGEIRWELQAGRKLSVPLFAVTVAGSSGLFAPPAPIVRVEARGRGEVLSAPVSASYGFQEATGDVRLRYASGHTLESCIITLRLLRRVEQKTISLHLVEAASGAELARLERIETAQHDGA